MQRNVLMKKKNKTKLGDTRNNCHKIFPYNRDGEEGEEEGRNLSTEWRTSDKLVSLNVE